MRLVLSPSLVKDPPQFVSMQCIHWETFCREFSSYGSLAIVLFVGKKVISRRSALEKCPLNNKLLRETQPLPSLETMSRKGKHKSEAHKVRREAQKVRREAKKRRRLPRTPEIPSAPQVYRRKTPSETPSSSSHPPLSSLDPVQEQVSTNTPGDSSSYE